MAAETTQKFSITDFYLILAMVIWGSDYLFAKIALREVSPMSFAAVRTLISASILVPIFLWKEKKWTVPRRHLLWLIGLTILGCFLNRIFFIVGLNLTLASNSALIMTTSPIFVLLASSFLFRSEVSPRAIAGILLSFLGVALVIQRDWQGWNLSAENFRGDLITLGASIFWSLFTVLSRRALKEYSSLKVSAYMMFMGTLLFLPFLPNEKSGGWWHISGLAWFSVLYVSILGNCLSYFLWVSGIKKIGALRTILYQYLQPVTAILIAVPFLGETLTVTQLCGAAVVFGGIFLARSG